MLHFVPTPIGNLEDITIRGLKTLESAHTIICEDTRVTKRLLHLLADKYSLSLKVETFISLHSHNEKEFFKKITPSLFENSVVYVSDAGMPSVSDPGCALIEYCNKNSIPYDVLPGANAALLAYVSSGFSQNRFLFFGFLPHKAKERKKELQNALYSGYITILYESPHRVLKLIDEIVSLEPNREIFLIKEATKLHQKSFLDSALNIQKILKDENLKGEWTVVLNCDKNIRKVGQIDIDDILELDISKKQASKLIAKITRKSAKECYDELL